MGICDLSVLLYTREAAPAKLAPEINRDVRSVAERTFTIRRRRIQDDSKAQDCTRGVVASSGSQCEEADDEGVRQETKGRGERRRGNEEGQGGRYSD